MKRDFLSVKDLSKEELDRLLKKTRDLKGKPCQTLLAGRTLAMVFAKPSTRTRVSFEVGMTQLGGHAIYLGMNELQISRGETIADTARVLSRYVDFIVARLFAHSDIEELARYSTVPVINGLTDYLHPCQALADVYTILEKKNGFRGLKMAYLGDGNNNVTHSLMSISGMIGLNMVVGCPKGYEPDDRITKESRIPITSDPVEAVKDADVVYTDTWVSMGKKDSRKRINALKPYQVNSEIMKNAKKDCIVMHCLPAHRGHEITDEVMDGSSSVVFDQAGNRLHTQKALICFLSGKT